MALQRAIHLESVESGVLRDRLREYRRRVRGFRLAIGALRCVAATAVLLAGLLLVEWFLKPGRGGCAFVLVLSTGTSIAFVYGLLLRVILRADPPRALAFEIERRAGGLRDLLVSAVQFSDSGVAPGTGVSRELSDLTVGEAERRLAGLDLRSLVSPRQLRAPARRALLSLLLVIGAWAASPPFFAVALRRTFLFGSDPWPTRTILHLVGLAGGVHHVPKGAALNLEVRVDPKGDVPARVGLVLRRQTGRTTRTDRRWMTSQDPLRFTATIEDVVDPLEVEVRGGDATVGPILITPVARPVITGVSLTCMPPIHVGARSFDVPLYADAAKVPHGSRLDVRATADRPVTEFSCALAGREPPPEPLVYLLGRGNATEDSPAFTLAVSRDLTLVLSVRDEHGIASDPPVSLKVTAVSDRKPQVKLSAAPVRDIVTPHAWFDATVAADDDYGLTGIGLKCEQVSGKLRADVVAADRSIAETERVARFSLARQVDLAPLNLKPGDGIELTGWAADNDSVGGPKRAESEPIVLKVLAPGDFLSVILVRQQTYRNQIERIIEQETGIAARLKGEIPANENVREMVERQQGDRKSVESLAVGYGAVLDELLHNRIIKRDAHERYAQGIVRALQGLAGPEGDLAQSERLLETQRAGRITDKESDENRRRCVQAVDSAVAVLKDVKTRMLLLERYAGLVATLEDLIERQNRIIGRTGQPPR